MSKTQAAYQKDYRARKKLTPNTNAPKTNAQTGPLAVYSPARWARLEDLGYVWDETVHRAVHPHRAVSFGQVAMAVPVPGDPAYQENAALSTIGTHTL